MKISVSALFSETTMQKMFEQQQQAGSVREYEKFGTVTARKAVPNEKIETVINGEVETTNTAKHGDWVLTGAKGEKYIVEPKQFAARYKKTARPGVYKATGTCFAFEVPKDWKPLKFKAPWGEAMIANPGDFIASTHKDGSGAYRIERDAFAKTYRLKARGSFSR